MDKPRINYIVDLLLGISFAVTAITGLLMFFFLPEGTRQGRYQELFGITKHVWSLVHDWAGIVLIVLCAIHLILHWNWIVCMTKSLFKK